ncbi:hypothetical protein ACFQAT_22885 [Undibacterium arcticum]|uniref:hypothetical protein n=1 Tax=Undibacterium arcticum TaxID=1762892 RepID=UPI0036197CB9
MMFAMEKFLCFNCKSENEFNPNQYRRYKPTSLVLENKASHMGKKEVMIECKACGKANKVVINESP